MMPSGNFARCRLEKIRRLDRYGGPVLPATTHMFWHLVSRVTFEVLAVAQPASLPPPVPRPLTIRNGVAQFDAGMKGATVFQGTVSPQGDLTMRDNLGDRLDGKIDPRGKATGKVNIGDQNCVLTGVWQKQ